ncbi:MAG: HEAT repeat domain-containing protein, partial [Myxococcales bacterium]|nr:HEAT repeat domain-containing protein [Myxococcales bacterium]
LAALGSATRINGFTDAPAVATLLGDRDPAVRRRSAEALGTLRAKDAATGLVALAKNDPDANVRSAACHTLGILGDPQARPVLEDLSKNDKDGFVRDMAQIALRRL